MRPHPKDANITLINSLVTDWIKVTHPSHCSFPVPTLPADTFRTLIYLKSDQGRVENILWGICSALERILNAAIDAVMKGIMIFPLSCHRELPEAKDLSGW